jgi:hypothetical protein
MRKITNEKLRKMRRDLLRVCTTVLGILTENNPNASSSRWRSRRGGLKLLNTNHLHRLNKQKEEIQGDAERREEKRREETQGDSKRREEKRREEKRREEKRREEKRKEEKRRDSKRREEKRREEKRKEEMRRV